MSSSEAYTKLDGELKDRFKKLLFHSYDIENANKRLQSLMWTCEMNPHAAKEDHRYYMIEEKDNILAYNGRMPAKVFFQGNIIEAFFVHETLVHPEYRRKGLGIEVNKNVVVDSNGLCMGLWANEKLLPLLVKIGWKEIGELRPFRKIIKIDGILKDKLKSRQIRYILTFIGNLYLKLAKQRHAYLSNSIKVFEIDRFKDDMQESLNNIIKKFSIITYRTADYFNWKYIDIPYREYKVYGVKKNKDLKGYVVLRVEKDIQKNLKKGIIVDLLCSPEEKGCFFSLVLKAKEYFIETGCDFIVCLLTFNKFSDWMRELKFSQKKLKGKSFFLLTNVDQMDDPEFAKDFRNWYITYGDSDYDMLTGTLKREAR